MIHERHQDWLSRRGIASDTAERMGVSTHSDDRGNWLTFPYRLDGEVVNRKRRMTAEKRHEMDKGGRLCLWNGEVLRSQQVRDGGSVIITEGEFDAMIAVQCGKHSTVSVPNGAPSERVDDPANAKRYAYLYDCHEHDLGQVREFILATDGDKPGASLATDLAAILGPERCRFVVYPEGTKDLNEVFLAHGQAGVVKAIDDARPWPVKGLYRMSDIPEAAAVQAMTTGIDALDPMMSIVLGTLTVFTGYANMGKSTVLNTLLASCVARGVPVCVASFETAPKPILRDGIARAMLGCSEYDYAAHAGRTTAWDRIEQHVRIVSNSLDEDTELDIDGFLDVCRAAVLRDGVRVIVLDPWNEVEHKRARDETTTEYVGRSIRKVKAFAKRFNVAFWIVAHPTKPQKGQSGIPSLYDVSDSANWSNKADYGLVYHRPDKTVNEATLAVVKVRMGLPGECGTVSVKFDHRVSRINGFTA